MNCSKVKRRLPAYAYNELPDKEKEKIANHLLACVSCSTELLKIKNHIQLFTEQLKPASSEVMDDELWDQIIQAINSEQRISSFSRTKTVKQILKSVWLNSLVSIRSVPLRKRAVVFASLFIIMAMIILSIFKFSISPQMWSQKMSQSKKTLTDYQVVESVNKPDVTVMTFNTNDPHIKIVWFFDKNFKL